MPESLPDGCGGEQRIAQAEKRHRVHSVQPMQESVPCESVEISE